ncbi:MAG: phosphoglycerate dehydrogenase [Nitrospinota bacterium]|nr:phosphoglycerate dehydrogenase [Nitrospinota bacterium]
MSATNVKILVSDKLSEDGIKILKAAPGFTVDEKVGLSHPDLLKIIGEYDGLVVRSATKADKALIEAGTRLKVIGRAGIGVDNVDVKAASARGVVVMNTPEGNIVTTAEHAISMMMALCRQIPQATASIREGKWEKKKFMGVEMFNKTLAVIGIGRIGSIVVRRARALEMKVIAFDPFISAQAAEKMGVELVTLEELFKRADFISIHTPLTEETKYLLGKENLAKMKKGVRIINCARGGIIHEADLAEAIKSGHVAGAALDVFEQEPPAKDNPLVGLENVIFTPHLGASTTEAQENVAIAVAEQFVDFFVRGITRNAVNMPSIPQEQLAIIRPYMTLGEKMGSFIAQVAEGGAKEIRIEYTGELSHVDQRPITQSVVKGVLEHYVGPTVNLVNAPYLAESRGVIVGAQSNPEKRNFAALLGVRLITEKGAMHIEGAVFLDGEPRLVRMEDIPIEASLEGTLILAANNDRPGVIGAIGACLGHHGVNIAAFHLGRVGAGGKAMAIVNVDSAPSPDQLKELSKIENVLDVKLARL